MPSSGTHEAIALAILRVVQSHYLCSICYDVYHDPVALPCGHVFCRGCVERCVKERPCCPLCNGVVSGSRVMTPLPALQRFSRFVVGTMRSVATTHRQPTVADFGTSLVAFDACGASGCVVQDETDRLIEGVAVVCKEGSFTVPVTQPLLSTAAVSSLTPPPARIVAAKMDHGTRAAPPTMTSYPINQGTTELTPLLHSPTVTRATSDSTTAKTTRLTDAQPSFAVTSRMATPAMRDLQYVTLVPPLVRQRREATICTEAAPDSALHRRGRCALCDLDITQRTSMRHYLTSLRRSAVGCQDDVLTRLTEHRLACLLGPLWEVVCDGGDDVLAHHNCLAWAGVLPTFTYRPFEVLCKAAPRCTPRDCGWCRSQTMPIRLAVPVSSTMRTASDDVFCRRKRTREERQRVVSTEALTHLLPQLACCEVWRDANQSSLFSCAVCGLSAAVGMRGCVGVGRSGCRRGVHCANNAERAKVPCCFHLPCALLADASCCVVYGMAEDDEEGGDFSMHGATVLESWADKVAVRCGMCHRAASP